MPEVLRNQVNNHCLICSLLNQDVWSSAWNTDHAMTQHIHTDPRAQEMMTSCVGFIYKHISSCVAFSCIRGSKGVMFLFFSSSFFLLQKTFVRNSCMPQIQTLVTLPRTGEFCQSDASPVSRMSSTKWSIRHQCMST